MSFLLIHKKSININPASYYVKDVCFIKMIQIATII